MKLLLDACVWGRAAAELQAAGHDVVWAGHWPEDLGDEEILDRARREGRVLVTLDKDFGELAVVYRKPHCGIVRLVDLGTRDQSLVCLRALTTHGPELQAGAIVTAEGHRLRVRPPEKGA